MKRLSIAACVLALAGCAKNPDSITAMSMPPNAYTGLSCEQLAAERTKSAAALDAVSRQQRDAVTGDAVGVFLIGVPMSSLTGGDKEGLVAQHKGELIAIDVARRNRACAA